MGSSVGSSETAGRPKFSEQYAKAQSEGGFCCKRCGCRHMEVEATRRWVPEKVHRVRKCRNCGWKKDTTEA